MCSDVSSPLVLWHAVVELYVELFLVPTKKQRLLIVPFVSVLSTMTPPKSLQSVLFETTKFLPASVQASWFVRTPLAPVDFSTLLDDMALTTSKMEKSSSGLIPNFSCM